MASHGASALIWWSYGGDYHYPERTELKTCEINDSFKAAVGLRQVRKCGKQALARFRFEMNKPGVALISRRTRFAEAA
jgi:hypothetical protein